MTEAVKRSALVTEWQLDPELESLLAVGAGPHADHLTDEQRVQIATYQATREASGHGDDPLLRPTYPIAWRHPVVPTPSARKDATQRRRMQ